MTSATQCFALPSPLKLRRGGQLWGAQLAYETWGQLNAKADNVVLLYTGMSPSAHAASNADTSPGWWEDMLGPGKPIDTQRWFVICANSLGSCKGSTGPDSINPQTGRAYRLSFPELSVEDIALSTHALLEGLGIASVHVVIGASMGGMNALAHIAQFPRHARHAVFISTAARAQPFAIAIRSLQRQLVIADTHFAGGDYADKREVNVGMGLARKLGVISYRSAEEWRTRFARQRVEHPQTSGFGLEFEVERYLQGHAERWAGSFDPCSYIYLSRAMDWFDLAEHGAGELEVALARAGLQRALVIGVSSDILFPLEQQAELAQGLRQGGTQVDFCPLASVQGHDSFLVDMQSFAPTVARFLASV